jgi:hypothetical protein
VAGGEVAAPFRRTIFSLIASVAPGKPVISRKGDVKSGESINHALQHAHRFSGKRQHGLPSSAAEIAAGKGLYRLQLE